MLPSTLIRQRIVESRFSLFFLCVVLTAGVSFGQVSTAPPDEQSYGFSVPEAIAKVQSGDFLGTHVDLLAEAHAVEAIPALEEQFVRTKDTLDKAKIAQALVKLGDKDETYWNFLVQLVTPAIESDAPDFFNRDAQGNDLHGLSPQFLQWAKLHNLSDGAAGENAVYIYPGEVALLGITGDRRAIPLLRRALQSPNALIQAAAATGLSELQDYGSIPAIIEDCRKAAPDVASLIAQPLAYFNDPQAQTAVDTYVPKDTAKTLREAKANGKGPFQ